jgi:hypothetical protein
VAGRIRVWRVEDGSLEELVDHARGMQGIASGRR